MVYIKTPSLYNVGFINPDYNDFLRQTQGLMSQQLASYCYIVPFNNSIVNPLSDKYTCNGYNSRPITFPSPSQGLTSISNTCACSRYVLPE